MVFDLLLILALIIINGFFALSEIAVVTAKKSRLKEKAEDGNERAKGALNLANNPNQFLSSIQVGITLISIIAGAYAGSNFTEPLATFIQATGWAGVYAWEIAYILVVAIVTYFTLIIGELVPKRLALTHSERFAILVARPMKLVSDLAKPVVWLLSKSTEGALFLFGAHGESNEPSVTTREIRSMLAEGIEEGTVEEEEHKIVTRLFQFGDQDVAAVMTPRREISGIDLEATEQQQKDALLELSHTRAIVYRKNMDEAVGIIHVRSILNHMLQDQPFNLLANVKDVKFVSENTSALQVLEYFRRTGDKMAIVVDEYGGVDGLVTLDDILEALVGDIPWVGDTLEPDIYQQEDGSWLVEGKVTVERFKDLLNLTELSDKESEQANYRTVGGWITDYFDQIPDEGESFEWADYRFKVLNMDDSRVENIQITKLDKPASGEEE